MDTCTSEPTSIANVRPLSPGSFSHALIHKTCYYEQILESHIEMSRPCS